MHMCREIPWYFWGKPQSFYSVVSHQREWGNSVVFGESFMGIPLEIPWFSEQDQYIMVPLDPDPLQLYLRTYSDKMNDKKYLCETCGAGFGRPSLLMEHQRVVHQGVTYPCSHCGQKFTSRVRRDAHQEGCGEQVQCYKCHKSFARTFIARHVKTCGLERERAQCPTCLKTFR